MALLLSDFELCTISLLVLLEYLDFVKKNFDLATIGGDTIVLSNLSETKGNLIPLSLRLRGIEFRRLRGIKFRLFQTKQNNI